MQHQLIVGHGTTIIDPISQLITPRGGSSIIKVDASALRNGNEAYHEELQYLGLLQELVDKHDDDPTPREDRTGTGTFSVFGRQIRFDLEQGFPLLTTKKVFWKGVVAELLWMLSGDTNARTLQDQGVHIWDEWADDEGELGPVYGKQWRAFRGIEGRIDQITEVIKQIKANPGSRRHIVLGYDPATIGQMALPPCHMFFQFYVEDGHLSCQLYQRSADIFLGVPFNIASYALLVHLIARETGLKPGEFVHTFGDLHLYANHVDAAKEQLSRSPRQSPLIDIKDDISIFDITPDDIDLIDYNPHPAIKAEVSV